MSSIPPQLTSALSEARGHLGLLAPVRLLRAVYNPFLDLVFPPRCAGCGRVDWHWCARCQAELDGEPFPAYVPPLPPLVGMAASAAHDGLVQRVIWSLKYENARAAALPLGQRLARRLALLRWPVDVIAPVPMHSSRLKARGYNQADLIAASAATSAGLPYHPAALTRTRFTPSQVGLGREARLSNVQDAFAADAAQVSGRAVLLIDDVYTTGATLSACADAALAAGASAVYGLTVSAARI